MSEVARAVLTALAARFSRFLAVLSEVSAAVLAALATRFSRFLAVLGEIPAAVLTALPAVGRMTRILILCHVGGVLSVSCYSPSAMANSEDRVFPASSDIVPIFCAYNINITEDAIF
jgi:hypothetical protein